MEIESNRGWRIFWLIVGLALSGGFVTGVILSTLQSGPSAVLIVASLFPIGIGIMAILWLGRPAWIRVGTTDVSYVPPLGSSKVFPRSTVKWIVRVPGGRGTSTVEFRDQDNRNLVVIEQGFARDDMQRLAHLLNAKVTWDLDWGNALSAREGGDQTSRDHALQEMMAMMTPEQRAVVEKRMKKSNE